MRWLFTVLRSRTFLSIFGALLVIALIIVAGAFFEWDWLIRILALLLVLVVVLVVALFRFMRANRSADRIERSIKMQAEQQLLSTRPDRRGEMEELQRRLEEAIERLKQSKLGGGKRSRAALYALPWYMFIGPPGAGKTTAIVNSGLNFPIGTDRVRGVGGTRNCDWFFTDQAILLDTAGRYMTEAEDSQEWLGFLDTLKQHRTERPINGVIVGIPVHELAGARIDEIEWHADNIRRRADELIQRLGVHFPVYLVFTKCDLLQGFVEFFGGYGRREREQIWGATFDAQQQQSGKLRAVFELEFDRLARALVSRRMARVGQPMKREERHKVYTFPLQFAAVRDNLAAFVERLFQPNPYQENPILRGFYFTSGTQEGVPLDRVIRSIAEQFDLAPSGAPSDFDGFGDFDGFAPEQEAKSYFLKNLFTDVVVPDQYMVRRTSKSRRTGKLQRAGVMAGAVAVLVLFLLGASQALVRSKMSLNQARDAAQNAAFAQWNAPGTTPENLARMDALDQELERLDKIQWLGLGLGRNGTVREPARRLYLDRARALVDAYPLDLLEEQMEAAARDPNFDYEQLYSALKAYLLLSAEARRLGDEDAGEGYRTFLVNTLTDLSVQRIGEQAGAEQAGAERPELREQVERPVTAFVDALVADTSWAFMADDRLVARTRERIYAPPSIASVYQRMKLEGRDNLPPTTLAELVPGRFLNLLRSDDRVSGFFTQDGWSAYVQAQIEDESRDPGGDDWVLGREGGELPAEMQNREQMAERLQELYYNDYASEWDRFLRSVRVQPAQNLRDAARDLQQLADPFESPIAYLLARATAETTFPDGLLGNLQNQAAEGIGQAIDRTVRRAAPRANAPDVNLQREQQLHPVERRFQWLHSLNAAQAQSNQASADYYAAFESLGEVAAQLDGLAADNAQASQFAADVLANNGGGLEDQMRNIRGALRIFDQEVRGHLFDEPILRAWSSVLGTAQQYLNQRWRETVYEPFRTRYAGQYPFDRTSTQDTPVMDVATFFDPASGPVAAFLNEELAPFVGRDLRPQTWEGRGVTLSPAARQAIERTESIAENLFSSGAMRVTFELQPEQPDYEGAAPTADRMLLQLLGQTLDYDLGVYRPTVSLEWPGESGALASLSTQSGTLPQKRYEGDWALFRLLQDARVQRRGPAQYQVGIPFGEPNRYTITALYTLRTRSSSNPFNDPAGFFSFNPPETLN